MGVLIRAHEWAATPLGPPEAWPESLRTALGILLNSGYPMYVAWGDEFTQIYNDAYRPILGSTKHPDALGASSADTFSEIWDYIGPMFRSVMQTGQASTFIDQLLPLNRHGYPEECYFVFSYSPVVTESGRTGGVFVTVLETTDRVLRERRQRILRELTAIPAYGAREDILRAAIEVLASDAEDMPLVRIHLPGDEGNAGPALTLDWPPGPTSESVLGSYWDRRAKGDKGPVELPEPTVIAPWPEPVSRLVRTPIPGRGRSDHAGDLLFGLSPRLPWDESYQEFLGAVARNVGELLGEADAFELERQRAAALAEIDAAKTAFFSNVSHEFRTPLTLMLSPLQELLDRPAQDTSEESRALVAVAHRNALRLLKLVNALLDFSRIEAGRAQAVYEPTDLAAFTSELASNFRSATDSAGLKLVVDCLPLSRPAFVDRDMWEKIVLNLVSNAFKFTFEGKILVRLRESEDQVELTVEDTGVGIPAEELPRLFERFHRVEGTRGRTYEGTGIGLALVDELVKLHGGATAVTSEVGRGTAFSVRIPLASAYPAQDHLPVAGGPSRAAGAQAYVEEARGWVSEPDQPFGGLGSPDPIPDDRYAGRGAVGTARPTILLADDNADLRNYLSRLLGTRGYQVIAVSDGEAALAAALDCPPDLVLSDVMMPRLNGFALLEALRAHEATRQVPTILLSARAGEEAKIEGLRAGADDYLVKPFSAHEMLARVESAIALARVRRQAAEALHDETVRVRRLFEQAPGFIAILRGPEHVFEFANAAYMRLVGERSVQGQPVRTALPEVEGQGFFELLDQVYATGQRFVGEQVPVSLQEALGAPPRQSVVDFIYEPIVDAEGQITGIFVEGHDVTEQQRAQAALGESQARLELATEAAALGVWDWDIGSGRMTYSARAKAICGFAPDRDVTYDDVKRVTHPEDYPQTSAMAQRALDPLIRSRESYHYRLLLPDGEVRWVIAHGEAVFAEIDGVERAIRYVGTLQDVTEPKRAEAALTLSEESLRLATSVANLGTWDLDLTTDQLTWSDRTKAAFGISPGAACSMADFYAGLHPDDYEATSAAFAAATDPDRRAEYDVEYRTIGKEDHLVRWVAAKGKGVFDEGGRCVRAIGTAIDITARKAVEERLRQSESELRVLNENLEREVAERTGERNILATIVQTTDVFIQVADLDFRYMAINRASADEFERIYGVRPAVGDNMLELLADQPDHQAAVRALWGRALAGEEFTVVEEFGDPARGRSAYEIKFNTLRDQEGNRVGAYQFVYDVTERLRDQARLLEAQDALRQSQKLEAIGQLTGGVAHDFNNLLTPIIGGLDMLQRRAGLDERAARIVDGALQAADRAKTLVQRLLAFSRRQPLQPAPVDVAGLIRGLADLVGSTTGPQIKVIVRASSNLSPALADHNQLEMAILNLAVNARDAMPEGGTLRITAKDEVVSRAHASGLPAGRYVRVSVADTGQGMDEETQRRAFEPFFSTKGIGRGTGLGLSMVHGLASQLGGALTVKSRLGLGTNFDLWLPASLAPVSGTAEQPAPESLAPQVGSVLLVDDEDIVRESTARMLEELGYQVVSAPSSEAALLLIDGGRPFDILVTDHLMPGMSGVDLARLVRSRRPGTPVLIVSGYAEATGIAPDLPRLTKPFRQVDLAASLAAAVATETAV